MSESFKDLTFVFTGNIEMDREEAKSKILLLGGRSTIGVSGKTSYLVTGNDPGPAKIEKAKKLKIKILRENEFMEMLRNAEKTISNTIDINLYESKSNSVVIPNSKKISENDSSIEFDLSSEELEKRSKNASMLYHLNQPWSEKYRPQKPEDLVGNPGAINSLEQFIVENYESSSGQKQVYKAVLLSGSPGVGKTTAIQVLCKKYHIRCIEYNASDIRNKKSIKEEFHNIKSKSIDFTSSKSNRLIVMDEVDGMTSDRGGISELTKLIKSTKIPIVCICNDRQHQQMQTLANYCLDIKFRKVDYRTILPRLRYILKQESKQLPDSVLNEIIVQCNGDLRYIINTLQKNKDLSDIRNINIIKKDASRSIFELSSEMFKKLPISEKIDIYFEEYTILPLFIQENYIKSGFYGSGNSIENIAKAAESISYGDFVDYKIHGPQQEYFLMPYHAFYSCVNASNNIKGGRMDFPLWLGQNSKASKYRRILLDIKNHLKYKLDKGDIRRYVMKLIYSKFISKLEINFKECIDILLETDLMKDDIIIMGDFLNEDSFKAIPAKVKSALTKEYKKLQRILPYSVREIEQDEE